MYISEIFLNGLFVFGSETFLDLMRDSAEFISDLRGCCGCSRPHVATCNRRAKT